jgi:hypothetical protein
LTFVPTLRLSVHALIAGKIVPAYEEIADHLVPPKLAAAWAIDPATGKSREDPDSGVPPRPRRRRAVTKMKAKE